MRDFVVEWLMPTLIAVVTVLLVMSTVTDAKPTPAPSSCSQLWEDLRENAKSINLLENVCFEIEDVDDKYSCYESVHRYKRNWLQTVKEYNLVCPENK